MRETQLATETVGIVLQVINKATEGVLEEAGEQIVQYLKFKLQEFCLEKISQESERFQALILSKIGNDADFKKELKQLVLQFQVLQNRAVVTQAIEFQSSNSTETNEAINQYHIHIYYTGLLTLDLEPLSFLDKLIAYFKVASFLIRKIVFYFLFEWFFDNSFPLSQTIDLILCCFRGTVASRVNFLQKKAQQSSKTFEKVDHQQQIHQLRRLNAEISLYIKLIECLGVNTARGNERIVKTLVALEAQQSKIRSLIESYKPRKYRILERIKGFLNLLSFSQEQRDFQEIEKILGEIISSSESSQLSRSKNQDFKSQFLSIASQQKHKIKPSNLKILYKAFDLFDNHTSLESKSNLDCPDSDWILLDELKIQRKIISNEFIKLLLERSDLEKECISYQANLSGLGKAIADKESEIKDLRIEISKYIGLQDSDETIAAKDAEIKALKSEIDELKAYGRTIVLEFKNLMEEKNRIERECSNYRINLDSFAKAIAAKESEIKDLQLKISRYSNFGDLSKTVAAKDLEIKNLKAELNKRNADFEASFYRSKQLESDLLEARRNLEYLQSHKRASDEKISKLEISIYDKQDEINKLIEQISKYAGVRMLEGEFIGNLSNKSSKYHFHRKCPDWKMLVGEYMLRLDNRDIETSSSPHFFIREGLEECINCAKENRVS